MSEPAEKCENYAIFKQNYTPELLIALKMVNSSFFGLSGNLDFPDFLQKKFYNINSSWFYICWLCYPESSAVKYAAVFGSFERASKSSKYSFWFFILSDIL